MKETPDTNRSIDRDLSALAARSRLHPPSLEKTIHTLSRSREGTREERFMAWNGLLRNPIRMATAAVVMVVAAVLLLVPVSYEKVVGHEVALSLDGSHVSQQALRGIAGELKTALGADGVAVEAALDNGKTIYTLSAKTSRKNAGAVAESFARALTAKGFEVAASSSPIRERVSGNVYAMAMNNVISISVDGKSADELETEIASQLAAAGIDAQVSVNIEGDDRMELDIRAERTAEAGEEPLVEPQIVLTSDGQPLGGDVTAQSVRVKVTEDQAGNTMKIEVLDGDQTYTATVDDPNSLSDGDLASRVHDLLAAQGQEFSVSAQDGRIRLMRLGADAATGVQKTSWGKLKQKMSEAN